MHWRFYRFLPDIVLLSMPFYSSEVVKPSILSQMTNHLVSIERKFCLFNTWYNDYDLLRLFFPSVASPELLAEAVFPIEISGIGAVSTSSPSYKDIVLLINLLLEYGITMTMSCTWLLKDAHLSRPQAPPSKILHFRVSLFVGALLRITIVTSF